VVFHSLHPDSKSHDQHALHTACPVITGVKYVGELDIGGTFSGGSWLATNRLACRLPHVADRSDEQRARTPGCPVSVMACGYSLACRPARTCRAPCPVPSRPTRPAICSHTAGSLPASPADFLRSHLLDTHQAFPT
jgi:hypothetical protein